MAESELSFKNLQVWSKAMDFASISMDITESFEGHFRIKEQLESSSASVPQNIAEGHGRISVKENIQYLYIARGSLYEALTILNLLHRKSLIDNELLSSQETRGLEIVKMINKLISSKRKFLNK